MAKLGREARKTRGRAPKIKVIDEMTEILKSGHGFVLANNKGLTLAEATELRVQCREANVKLKVVKNTLLRRSLDNAGIESGQFESLLKLETVIAVGLEDPISPAKVLAQFLKKHENKLEFKGGYLEGNLIDAAGVEVLSQMPGRDELLSKMLGSLQAPVQNLVYALNACVGKVVYAVDAYKRKLEGGDAA
jgi:large subunit ribosomal protein L10